MTNPRKKNCWKNLNKEWIPEIVLFGGLTLGLILFIFSKAFNINFWTQIQSLLSWVKNIIQFILTPNNIIAVILIIGLLGFALVRIRYHLLRLVNSHRVCPVCHQTIHKTHRQKYQRLLSYYIPVRRYYCRYCGWKGLRVYQKKKRTPNK